MMTIFHFFLALTLYTQPVFDFEEHENKLVFEACISQGKSTVPLYTSDIMKYVVALFRSPYQAGTLEGNETEQLVVNLEAFDCTTFVETVMALTLAGRRENPTYEDFKEELQRIRYRDGIIDGYSSRLHYISDWIRNNKKMGIIEDVTDSIGGIPFSPKLSYMSTHPELYTALKANPAEVEKMKAIEEEVNQDTTLYYIPKGKITRIASKIQDGDILFFTTSIAGLDVQHAGIAYRFGKQLSFFHASSLQGEVAPQPGTLSAYCRNSKTITGIIVVRLNSKQ
ncbi:DUF1460 domain-containing protein [Bacteroidales bacterium OttesenSCG-928-J19]|nr:DUF1460 domain-containing protein [Bacteroidales bacterium OttesenSCG-928-J19]